VPRPVEDILESCWAKDLAAIGNVDPSMIFRHVAEAISQALDIKDDSGSSHEVPFNQLPENSIAQVETRRLSDQKRVATVANRYDLIRDLRWMAEEQYVQAWEIVGITI
jgi:hypothetical protein